MAGLKTPSRRAADSQPLSLSLSVRVSLVLESPGEMQIRVLYFDGCPHWREAAEAVRRIAARLAVPEAVECIPVDSVEDAVRRRFLGSPSIQIDGVDIEPSARQRTDFTLACRIYGSSGVPPEELIESAIREASA